MFMKLENKMTLQFLNVYDYPECINRVQMLYESSFPIDEQVPFAILFEQSKSDISNLYAIFDKGMFVGLLCTVYDAHIVFCGI